MNNNTLHRGGSTLPPHSNPAQLDDGRRRTISDPPHLSVPEPFQSIPAQELLKDNCGYCGWIRKEGGSIKTWHDRYVILHKGCLYYYYKPEAATTAGKFSLSGYRLSPAPEKSSKYQWTFKLVHIQPEKRTYYFAAYSEREMNEWMENITQEMEEYCGTGKQTAETTEAGDGAEYCYPEVEPRFDPEEFAVLFGRLSPSLPRKPTTSEPFYCPPPEMEPSDVMSSSPQPPRHASHPLKQGSEFPKGCNLPIPPFGSSLRPMKPPPGSSPVFPRIAKESPAVPSRAGKPANGLKPSSLPRPPGSSPVFPHHAKGTPAVPSRPLKPVAEPAPSTPQRPKPKPLPRPPLTKHSTEPFLKYEKHSEGQDDDEVSEGYLDIVPETTPEDVFDEGRKSTLSRGYPDGNSFRQRHTENVVLPPTALRLDIDKTAVTKLLEYKQGVYIVRKSENAQSQRALAVWTGDRVRHYMIFYDKKTGYALEPDGEHFDKLEDLLWHYREVNLPKCDVKLIRPYK